MKTEKNQNALRPLPLKEIWRRWRMNRGWRIVQKYCTHENKEVVFESNEGYVER